MTKQQIIDRLDELEEQSARGMEPAEYAENIRERVMLQEDLDMWGESRL